MALSDVSFDKLVDSIFVVFSVKTKWLVLHPSPLVLSTPGKLTDLKTIFFSREKRERERMA